MANQESKSMAFLPGALGSVAYGVSKKVTVASAATALCTANEMQLGIVVRAISLDSAVTFGASDVTVDSGSAPGAHVLTAANQGLTLNISGNIYATTQTGSASIAVTVLNLP